MMRVHKKNGHAGHVMGVVLLLCVLMATPAYGNSANSKKANYNEGYEVILSEIYNTLSALGESEVQIVVPDLFASDAEIEAFAKYVYQVYDLTGRVKVQKSTVSSQNGKKYKALLQFDNPCEVYEEQKAAEQILIDFAAGLEGLSDYDKVILINDWLSEASYDYTLQGKSCYANLVEKASTCNGFARAFYGACSYAGVDCENVRGWVGDTYHMWNRVLVDGSWKYVDVTWNSMAGENKWLLITREEMNQDRREA